jgi:large subunit ribosomal protein L21
MEGGMYAIIRVGGRQFKVSPGESIQVERLAAGIGETVELGHVLLIVDDGQTVVGQPTVPKAVVQAKVVDHVRGPKSTIFKFLGGNRYPLKRGHRQGYTRLLVEEILREGARKKRAAAAKPKKTAKPPSAVESVSSPDVSVEALGLPARVQSALGEAGLQTVGDLLGKEEGELLAIRGIGAKAVEQIRAALKDKGFIKK